MIVDQDQSEIPYTFGHCGCRREEYESPLKDPFNVSANVLDPMFEGEQMICKFQSMGSYFF